MRSFAPWLIGLMAGGIAFSGLPSASCAGISLSSMLTRPQLDSTFSGKTAVERANAKAQDIAALPLCGTYQAGSLRIEIRSVAQIAGGVELYARAWRGSTQLGFGVDGTTEWERFRFINPPILIPDPAGSIVRRWTDEKGASHTRPLTEDPAAAIREALRQTIALVGRADTTIVLGSVGHTTTTFYPDADPESTSVDGFVQSRDATSDWATAWNATDGTGATDNGTSFNIVSVKEAGLVRIARGFFLFDTSSLTSGVTVSSATFSLHTVSGASSPDAEVDPVYVVSSSPASNTSLSTADYDQRGAVSLGGTLTYSADAYIDSTLNASGIANISKTGVSKFAALGDDDFNNVTPTSHPSTNGWSTWAADQTGTTQDPKLTVVYAPTPATAAVRNANVILFGF